ncbi:MAG: ABC transporter ATP-binding protein [Lachnospiraceae bacterium]|nr:ABC transporter ATP-binding protein [Lachnospiraceae bacterium]
MAADIISVENLSVRFRMPEQKVDNFKEYLIRILKRKLKYKEFNAINNISFSIKKGDRLGVVGANGAGKSTLLKVIAGVLKASEGTVKRNGKVVPLLELGAGFEMQYTGAENIYLYGAMLGYSKAFIDEKYKEIVDFADLGDFINVPVKNYSSGMRTRLGFAIVTVVEPDILILDEVFAVGDAKFREKSEKKIRDMFEKGATVIFVSHNEDQVKRLCNRGILLDHGKLIADGDLDEVYGKYHEITNKIK